MAFERTDEDDDAAAGHPNAAADATAASRPHPSSHTQPHTDVSAAASVVLEPLALGVASDDDDADDDEERRRRGYELLEALRAQLRCPACANIFEHPVALKCGHSFCRSCLRQIIDEAHPPPPRCPTCQMPLSDDDDDEPQVCIALQNCAVLVMSPADLRRSQRPPSPTAPNHDDRGLGELLRPASNQPVPDGWQRLHGFEHGVVFATRSYRRDSTGRPNTNSFCILISNDPGGQQPLNTAGLDFLFFQQHDNDTVRIQYLTALVQRVEGEQTEPSDGLPWIMGAPPDWSMIADEGERQIVLVCDHDPHPRTGLLSSGRSTFQDVVLRFQGTNGWASLLIVDPDAALEYKLAFRRHRPVDDHGDVAYQPIATNDQEEEEGEGGDDSQVQVYGNPGQNVRSHLFPESTGFKRRRLSDAQDDYDDS